MSGPAHFRKSSAQLVGSGSPTRACRHALASATWLAARSGTATGTRDQFAGRSNVEGYSRAGRGSQDHKDQPTTPQERHRLFPTHPHRRRVRPSPAKKAPGRSTAWPRPSVHPPLIGYQKGLRSSGEHLSTGKRNAIDVHWSLRFRRKTTTWSTTLGTNARPRIMTSHHVTPRTTARRMAAVPTTIHKARPQGRLAVACGRDRVRNPITTHIAPIPTTNTYGRAVLPSIIYVVLPARSISLVNSTRFVLHAHSSSAG